MKLLQINAVYGIGSTGTIVKDIDELAQKSGIDSYVAYSSAFVKPKNGYQIGGTLGKKVHALLCRIAGKQAYFSSFATEKLIRYIEKLSPDIVHLHNLHSNFINLNMLLKYLAKKDIKVMLTQHDCWYYTGKCFHYTAQKCYKWQTGCKDCPKKHSDTPAYLYSATEKIWKDRNKYFSAIKNLTVVSVSEWLTKETKKSLLKDKKLITIYNGIDTNIFKPTDSDFRKRYNIENKFVILCMANKWFLPKNSEITKQLIENLNDNQKIVVLGCSDEQKDKLTSTDVLALGYIKDREALAEVYSAADVFVNPSYEDTLGMVNLESLACGTPNRLQFDRYSRNY